MAALKTPLHSLHTKLGGKLVNYANYLLPISYPSQSHIDSHLHVRSQAGLFDVSHMLQHRLVGPRAVEFLETLTPTDLQSVPVGSCHLSALLNAERGGIVDDTIITRVANDEVYFVSNGATSDKVSKFIEESLDQFDRGNHGLEYTNFKKALVAVQGPRTAGYLGEFLKMDLSKVFFGNHFFGSLESNSSIKEKVIGKGFPQNFKAESNGLLVSRTGYTGEDGFEISIPNEELALDFVSELLSKYPGIQPIGLAARDSLRLEAGLCLYGSELTEDITPVEASLNWIVSKSRRDPSAPGFNGADKIRAQLKDKTLVPYKRIGFQFEDGAAARHGAKIFVRDQATGEEKEVGFVTSGSLSPSLSEGATKRVNIGQGYVKMPYHKKETDVLVQVRKKLVEAKVKKMPFVEAHYYKG